MWNAYATRNGVFIYDWQTEAIPDTHLDCVFNEANKQLQLSSCSSTNFLRLGRIAHGECRDMLSYSIKRSVINYHKDGIMEWTDIEVQEINKGADWNFPLRDALEDYEHDDDEFYICAFHTARLFWETCVKEHLGITFTF